MKKSELIKEIARKCDLTPSQSKDIVDNFFNSIMDGLREEKRVEIRGFGNFTMRKYKAYLGRNPGTGESIQVPEKERPFFKAGSPLRKRIAESDICPSQN